MNFFITALVRQFANSSLFLKCVKYLENPQFWDENDTACLGRASTPTRKVQR